MDDLRDFLQAECASPHAYSEEVWPILSSECIANLWNIHVSPRKHPCFTFGSWHCEGLRRDFGCHDWTWVLRVFRFISRGSPFSQAHAVAKLKVGIATLHTAYTRCGARR